MPEPDDNPSSTEQRLAQALVRFDHLDDAWPRAQSAVERGRIGREREDTLSKIATLEEQIISARAEILADAAAQLRRLAALTEAAEGKALLRIMLSDEIRSLVQSALDAVRSASMRTNSEQRQPDQ